MQSVVLLDSSTSPAITWRELLVRDLNSTLGRIVNGRPLGRDLPSDSAPLHKGDNTVIAGGKGSPFAFVVTPVVIPSA